MSKPQEKSADEISNKDVAAEVITPKRKYFFPDKGVTVEVTIGDDENKNMATAIKLAEKAEKGDTSTTDEGDE